MDLRPLSTDLPRQPSQPPTKQPERQRDFFGNTRIQIEGNPLLEMIANHILDLVQREPALLDGEQVGVIDRKIMVALWADDGIREFIPADKWESFKAWATNPKRMVDPEAISRARRYLAEKDYIRLSQTAIKSAEFQRQRIGQSVKGN